MKVNKSKVNEWIRLLKKAGIKGKTLTIDGTDVFTIAVSDLKIVFDKVDGKNEFYALQFEALGNTFIFDTSLQFYMQIEDNVFLIEEDEMQESLLEYLDWRFNLIATLQV